MYFSPVMCHGDHFCFPESVDCAGDEECEPLGWHRKALHVFMGLMCSLEIGLTPDQLKTPKTFVVIPELFVCWVSNLAHVGGRK